MYKRDRFVFVSNLQDVTCDPENPITLKRDAYLLSEHYSTPALINKALYARKYRNTIVSDNGNFSRMKKIAAEYLTESAALRERAIKSIENKTKFKKISIERDELIKKVSKQCEDVFLALDWNKIIKTELLIRPHLFISIENLTIPVLDMLGLFDFPFSSSAKQVISYQRQSRRYFIKVINDKIIDEPIPAESLPVHVIHGFNYSSSKQAAKLVSNDKELKAIAISYGAAMKSNKYIESLRLGKRKINFSSKLPEKYIKAQSLLIGALDGLNRKVRVHILGTGSPILLVLTAALMDRVIGISIDSTAPFKDSDDSVIYGSRLAFIKMKMYRVAAFHLVDGTEYTSDQPFWIAFNKKYPSDWEGLRGELNVRAMDDYKELAKRLETEQELVRKFIPYFSKQRGGRDKFYSDLRLARSGSNFWIIKEICDHIRRRLDDHKQLQKWVEKEVDRYREIGSPRWARAVEETFKFSKK